MDFISSKDVPQSPHRAGQYDTAWFPSSNGELDVKSGKEKHSPDESGQVKKYLWNGKKNSIIRAISQAREKGRELYAHQLQTALAYIGGAWNTLVLTCELWTYLADLDEQAWERLDAIMEQMKAAEGVTEELKAREQWVWIQKMNSIRNRAEEIVRNEPYSLLCTNISNELLGAF